MRGSTCILGLLLELAAGCAGSLDKPEQITRARALGVSATPIIAAPSDTVTLTFHLAVEKTDQVTLTPGPGLPDSYGVSIPVQNLVVDADTTIAESICPNHVARCSFAQFDYVAVHAHFTVPPNSVINLSQDRGLRLRYTANFSAGSYSEPIVGEVMVFGAGSTALSAPAQPPAVAIVAPGNGGPLPANNNVDIGGTITKYFSDEVVKVGWFVGGGTITNRRDETTQWKTPDPGVASLVFTARGNNSKFMAIAVKDFVIQ